MRPTVGQTLARNFNTIGGVGTAASDMVDIYNSKSPLPMKALAGLESAGNAATTALTDRFTAGKGRARGGRWFAWQAPAFCLGGRQGTAVPARA
jgi:hypothetical protein